MFAPRTNSLLQNSLWLRWYSTFTCIQSKKAVSVCSRCMFSLLPTQVCERRLCLRLVCVAVECVCQLVRRPDTLRKWWGQGGRPPHPYPTHTHTKKRGFIATSLGQRASGLSFPHRTIISFSPTTEKYGLETWR